MIDSILYIEYYTVDRQNSVCVCLCVQRLVGISWLCRTVLRRWEDPGHLSNISHAQDIARGEDHNTSPVQSAEAKGRHFADLHQPASVKVSFSLSTKTSYSHPWPLSAPASHNLTVRAVRVILLPFVKVLLRRNN